MNSSWFKAIKRDARDVAEKPLSPQEYNELGKRLTHLEEETGSLDWMYSFWEDVMKKKYHYEKYANYMSAFKSTGYTPFKAWAGPAKPDKDFARFLH